MDGKSPNPASNTPFYRFIDGPIIFIKFPSGANIFSFLAGYCLSGLGLGGIKFYCSGVVVPFSSSFV